MPLHRITIDMIFEDLDPMQDILDKVKGHQDQAITMNPGQINEEHSYWTVQTCHHADPGGGKCQPVDNWISSDPIP